MVAMAIIIVATGALMMLLMDKPQITPWLSLGMGLLIFILAYIAHRVSGADGNPFNGLTLGGFKWIFLVWLGGLFFGVLSVGIALGLGFVGIDMDMNWFLAMTAEQASQGGKTVTVADMTAMKGFLQIGSLIGSAIGPFFLAGLISMSYFALFGWLSRRLLVRGLPYTMGVLVAFGALSTLTTVFMPNPMVEETNYVLAIPISILYGVLITAITYWLFLMSNSAVIPALAVATFSAGIEACKLYYADPQPYLVPSMGAADLLVLLLVALALWMIKVPGTKQMEVAAVAFDGTSLNSAQLAALESGSSMQAVIEGQAAPADAQDEAYIAPPPDAEG